LLHSWAGATGRRFLADIVVNIALYIPLGTAGYLAFAKHRIAGPVALALTLSAITEMLQLFIPGRICSALDLSNNVIGASAGVLCGMLFEHLAGPQMSGFVRHKTPDRSALALLFCWVALLLFPLFPVTALPIYRDKFALFAKAPWLEFVPFLSGLATWFVAGRLLMASAIFPAVVWLGISLLLVPAQFLIVSRQPMPTDVFAAITGFLLFLCWGRRKGMDSVWACGFVIVLLIRGLAPFRFTETHSFAWVPFGGFLDMNWQSGIGTLLEKTFYYGCAVWLVRAAGARWRAAITSVALLLAVIEVTQTRLPGRTAEITDPVLAVLVGLGLMVLNPRRSPPRDPLVRAPAADQQGHDAG
jgi:VanZ family protein